MPPEENAPPSIADSLAAAIDTVESAPTAPAAQDNAVGAVETAPARAAADPTPPAQDKPPASGRDTSGRFTPKKADAAPAAVPANDAPAAKVDAAAPNTPGAKPETPGADAAPQSWREDLKAKWTGLDAEVKGEIARREREITVGLQRAAETRKFGDSIAQEFAPYAEILNKEGASPQQAIRALLETSYTLSHGSYAHKHALFMSLAQQYGIDLTKAVDPEKARLEWELDSRKQADMRGGAQQQEQIRNEAQQELEGFIAAPGHEHYATVRTAMAGLMQSGTATSLQDAYDQACWANPTLRATLQQAEDLKRAAAQAKNRNALGAVNGAPGAVSTGAPATDVRNLRGVIESQFGGGRV